MSAKMGFNELWPVVVRIVGSQMGLSDEPARSYMLVALWEGLEKAFQSEGEG